MNIAILTGNLIKENNIKYTSNGVAILSNTIAIKRNYKNANNEYESDFVNIKAFDKKAEYLSKYANKGDKITIKGRIQTSNYEDKEGNKKYITEVIVEDLTLMSKKQAKEEYANIDENFLD